MESCHSLRDELQLKTEENLRLTKEAEEVKSQLQHQHNQVKSALNLELTCVICSELMIEVSHDATRMTRLICFISI